MSRLYWTLVCWLVAICVACGESASPPVVTSIEVSPATATLASLNDTVRFAATARDQNGQVMTGRAFTWSSSNPLVAEPINATAGLTKALGVGTAQIMASNEGIQGAATLVVEQRVADLTVLPLADTLTAIGDTLRYAATALDAGGSPIPSAQFTWTSSNEAVVIVVSSNAGLVQAVANGSAQIAATVDGVQGTAELVVSQLPAVLTVSPEDATLTGVGATMQLSVSAVDARGNGVGEFEVDWSTSDALVAAVDADGLVTATGIGSASIAATSGVVADTMDVVVVAEASALDFSGSYVVVPDGADLDLQAEWTIEAWIKPRALGGLAHLVSKWGDCSTGSYSMELNGGRLRSGIASCASGTQVVESPDVLVADQWQHVAITLARDTLRLFVNGALQAMQTGSIAPSNTATAVWFGQHTGGGYPFDGVIDEIRMWQVQRTEAQLSAAMNLPLVGDEVGLVAYWRFDEGSGDMAFDATGRGNDGRLGNAVGPDANDPTWTTDAPPMQ